MNTLLKRSGSKRSLGMVALRGLASLAGTGPLACGQETFQGKLTLPVEARLGNTVLPPGEYQLRVALVGTTLSVNSIQDVYTPVMVMVTPLTKGGPSARSGTKDSQGFRNEHVDCAIAVLLTHPRRVTEE